MRHEAGDRVAGGSRQASPPAVSENRCTRMMHEDAGPVECTREHSNSGSQPKVGASTGRVEVISVPHRSAGIDAP